ncbi:MAG: DUF2085 domain-containing protein, partial [Anaerolineales bacterium]
MITVTLFTRKNCHLCEQAKADLEALQGVVPHRLVEIDIESDPVLHQKYLTEIPVIEVGPYRKAAPFTRQDLQVTLSAARDRQDSLERIGAEDYRARVRRGQQVSGADRFSFWLSQHYLLLLNLIVLLYVGIPFLAPVLMKAGLEAPARVIYAAYSPLCHQLGFRSMYLFGEQMVYPRALAGMDGLKTFSEATDLDEFDLWAARRFVGNEQVGYKVALCERDVAIYLSIVLFGLVYAATGRRLPKLHWVLWLFLGIGPIGLDGFSQLFSQALPGLESILPMRESTLTLRLLTGSLFGFMTAWFG